MKESSVRYIFFYGLFSFLFCLFKINFTIADVYNLLMVWAFPLSFLLFYYASFNVKSQKTYRLFVVLYYLLLVLISATNLFKLTGKLSYIMISNVYYLLCLFPLALYFCKKKALLILLTFVPVITSEKRIAFIAFAASVIIYIILKMWIEKDFARILKYVGAAVIIGALLVVILIFFEKNYGVRIISRLLNIVADDGSGRGSMYQSMIDAFKSSPFLQKIFGHGMDSSQQVLVVHDDVHDDFIQILYEYGLLSFFSFLLFYCSLLCTCIKNTFKKTQNTIYIFPLVIISLCLSLFSVFITDYTYSICASFSLGNLLAFEKKENYGIN